MDQATVPDLGAMTPIEIMEWAISEPELPSLSSIPLSTPGAREEFFRVLALRGEEAVFEAVSHVWCSLAEPQDVRCTLMGVAAGTGGTGKTALLLIFKQFIAECLAIDTTIPKPETFESFEEWNTAALATFHHHSDELLRLARKYSDLLDGAPRS